jgi:hypothetical protein
MEGIVRSCSEVFLKSFQSEVLNILTASSSWSAEPCMVDALLESSSTTAALLWVDESTWVTARFSSSMPEACSEAASARFHLEFLHEEIGIPAVVAQCGIDLLGGIGIFMELILLHGDHHILDVKHHGIVLADPHGRQLRQGNQRIVISSNEVFRSWKSCLLYRENNGGL